MDEEHCMSYPVHEMDWEMGLGRTWNNYCAQRAVGA
jgi:hypothetical protein